MSDSFSRIELRDLILDVWLEQYEAYLEAGEPFGGGSNRMYLWHKFETGTTVN